jgi:putative phosphoesterase
MIRAVEKESPRMIFHLGDCWRDAERLQTYFPDIPLQQVPGNCDFRPDDPAEQLLCLDDRRILLCHGHTFGVKSSLLRAGYAAEEKDLDVFLFGHTHMPLVDLRGKTLFLNPGSIGDYLQKIGDAPPFREKRIKGSNRFNSSIKTLIDRIRKVSSIEEFYIQLFKTQ